jgi:MFS family permease
MLKLVWPLPHIEHQLASACTYCFVLILLGIQVGSLGPSLLELSSRVSASLQDTSYAASVRSITFLTFSCAGPLLDYMSPHGFLASACIVAALGNILIPLTQNLSGLYAATSLQGIAGGIVDTGTNVVMLWAFAGMPMMRTHVPYTSDYTK